MKLYRPVTIVEVKKEIQDLGLSFQLSRQLDFRRAFDKMTHENIRDFDNFEERTEKAFENLVKEEKIEEAYKLIQSYIPSYDVELSEQLEHLLVLGKAKKDIENGITIYTDYKS